MNNKRFLKADVFHFVDPVQTTVKTEDDTKLCKH